VAVYSGVGGAAMVSSSMPGFPPRGSTLYVFSLNGDSPHGGAGMYETEGGGPAARHDHGMGGKP
jgi:alcohol dehydrogenase (cytochrome c)